MTTSKILILSLVLFSFGEVRADDWVSVFEDLLVGVEKEYSIPRTEWTSDQFIEDSPLLGEEHRIQREFIQENWNKLLESEYITQPGIPGLLVSSMTDTAKDEYFHFANSVFEPNTRAHFEKNTLKAVITPSYFSGSDFNKVVIDNFRDPRVVSLIAKAKDAFKDDQPYLAYLREIEEGEVSKGFEGVDVTEIVFLGRRVMPILLGAILLAVLAFVLVRMK